MTILTGHLGAARHAARRGGSRREWTIRTVDSAACTRVAAALAVVFTGLLGVGAVSLFGRTGVAFAGAISGATGVWLIGAVETMRTVRRQAPLSAAADRAAIAELRALLERE